MYNLSKHNIFKITYQQNIHLVAVIRKPHAWEKSGSGAMGRKVPFLICFDSYYSK